MIFFQYLYCAWLSKFEFYLLGVCVVVCVCACVCVCDVRISQWKRNARKSPLGTPDSEPTGPYSTAHTRPTFVRAGLYVTRNCDTPGGAFELRLCDNG